MKACHKALVRERAREALGSLYHNATPAYPDFRNDFEADQFWSWFQDTASFEVDYIQSGGANGDIARLASTMPRIKARGYVYRASLERAQYAPWESIGQYGRIYQYGRGGRTLAPKELIQTRGGSSFSIRESIADEWSIPALTDLIRVLESFNAYVNSWCDSLPELWREHKKESGLNRVIWRYDGKTRRSVTRYA